MGVSGRSLSPEERDAVLKRVASKNGEGAYVLSLKEVAAASDLSVMTVTRIVRDAAAAHYATVKAAKDAPE